MRRRVVPWILALVLVGFYSWPVAMLAHGDEDRDAPTPGCATTPKS